MRVITVAWSLHATHPVTPLLPPPLPTTLSQQLATAQLPTWLACALNCHMPLDGACAYPVPLAAAGQGWAARRGLQRLVPAADHVGWSIDRVKQHNWPEGTTAGGKAAPPPWRHLGGRGRSWMCLKCGAIST